MKLVSALFAIAFSVGCMEESRTVDAELVLGPHDLLSSCDPRWDANFEAPGVCDHACSIPPEQPVTGGKLCVNKDGDRPCYNLPACDHAWSPSSVPVNCERTFDAGGGVTGCCAMREIAFPKEPTSEIPTFYECR